MATNNAVNEPTAASGTVLQGQGVGTASAFSTSTYPSTNATGDLIYGSTTNAFSALTVGARDGTPLGVNSGLPIYLTPLKYVYFFDDLLFPTPAGNNTPCGQFWTNSTANSGTTTQAASDTNHPGVILCSCTTTTNGAAGLKMGNNTGTDYAFNLGGGALDMSWSINLSALSNGTDTYTIRIGMANANSTAAPSNGIYFSYTDTGASANWKINTTASSSTTTQDSAIAVTASAWHTLRITVNAAATSIAFYIDGVQATNSPLSTNIPTARIAPELIIIKSAGTTLTTMSVDYCSLYQVLTTART
jgi:hypothetical protein